MAYLVSTFIKWLFRHPLGQLLVAAILLFLAGDGIVEAIGTHDGALSFIFPGILLALGGLCLATGLKNSIQRYQRPTPPNTQVPPTVKTGL